jgi:hypothetical protein
MFPDNTPFAIPVAIIITALSIVATESLPATAAPAGSAPRQWNLTLLGDPIKLNPSGPYGANTDQFPVLITPYAGGKSTQLQATASLAFTPTELYDPTRPNTRIAGVSGAFKFLGKVNCNVPAPDNRLEITPALGAVNSEVEVEIAPGIFITVDLTAAGIKVQSLY